LRTNMRNVFKIRSDTSSFTKKPKASTLYSKVPLFSTRGDLEEK
jgi:hypothetical protein